MGGLLEVRDLRLRFGGIQALAGVSLELGEGETLGLVGPNGSGKTSLLNCIGGFYAPSEGSITFAGASLLGLSPDGVARRGIARTFQGLRLFSNLSVLDNLMLGRHLRFRRRLGDALLRRRQEEARQRAPCDEILALLSLQAWRHRRAGECPYGVQKRAELGRALATGPRLLLLDEPVSGLSEEEKEEVAACVDEIRARSGMAVLLVEHDLGVAARLAARMVVLEGGAKIAEGRPEEVRRDRKVARGRLGAG
jgi:branched-chain amino acid transport system ATP-binding protein